MEYSRNTRERLVRHSQCYPGLQPTDVFKYLFQSALGCEHMVASEAKAIEYIRREYDAVTAEGAADCLPRTERLDGGYTRVHLSCLDEGLTAETLGRLFCLSAVSEPNGREALEEKLQVARELAKAGEFPFSADAFEEALAVWRENGCPAVHHSRAFREAYRPAYRVIANRYAAFLSLFTRIDALMRNGLAVVALEGGSASGKTTLSGILETVYGCTVFHADDFFLRPEQRTRERLSEIGGNLDRERLLSEVLKPLRRGEPIRYRRFDCSRGELESPVETLPKKLVVVEGAYSMHPELAGYYDFSVFLDIDPVYQRERILARNSPAFAERFFREWIPLEREYFSHTDVRNRCDLAFEIRRESF